MKLQSVRDGDAVEAAAQNAAAASGVDIALVIDVDQCHAVSALLYEIWRSEVVDRDLLRALVHSGNYAALAYADGTPVGAAAGFFDADGHVHSHVAGVVPGMQGRGVGFALKLHQRAWALERGIGRITWTYDPLVRRNAWFNLQRLGARAARYLVDFYGQMRDGINTNAGSDRILVEWTLDSERVQAAIDGDLPVPEGERRVPIPEDVEALRGADPERARQWRLDVRTALTEAYDEGLAIVGVERSGSYVLGDPAGAE